MYVCVYVYIYVYVNVEVILRCNIHIILNIFYGLYEMFYPRFSFRFNLICITMVSFTEGINLDCLNPSTPAICIDDLNEVYLDSIKGKFSILNLNIRSISKHFDDLKNLLSFLKFEISCIVLTETWLSKTNINDIYELHN